MLSIPVIRFAGVSLCAMTDKLEEMEKEGTTGKDKGCSGMEYNKMERERMWFKLKG